jgi:mycothiol system anti-sigma-R factor
MAKCGPECEETLQEIERFLDHEVDEVIRVRVERHLSGCDDCTDKATFRLHLKTVIHAKCAEHEVPDGLRERLRTILSTADPGVEPR